MCSCFGINCNFTIPDQLVLWCFPHEGAPRRRSINGLRDDWQRLKAKWGRTERRIRESNPHMLPTEQVNEWLRQVAVLEPKIEKLITDYNGLHPRTYNTQESADNSLNIDESLETRPPEEAIQNSKCFCKCSAIINCIKSCYLWRKIQLMDQKVLDLLQQTLDPMLEMPLIAPALQRPTEPTTGMQSMLDEVWSHVENQQGDHARLIGLHGLGGVGKTTLLKAVQNKLCSSTLNFDLQLWIVVSRTPKLVDIQNFIGEKIGFRGDDWKVKSPDEKATEIYNVLRQKKYILLLDDLWERFDLTKIGIPLPDLTNKSMVIFTTRSLQLCGQMKATKFQVRCLNDEEAWNLFKENVGEDALNAHSDIPGLARVVMRECCGLPLALNVIGRAMSLKTTVPDWEHAINVLQGYAADLSSTITDEVFTPLKYSFDNLTNDAIRSCFLYCSLYAEDQEILISDLVDKWICEDFLGGSENLHNARNKGRHYISTLLHASLLEECPPEKVKMHDVIRDMALWITSDKFYVKARAGLTRIPNDVKWGHVEKLSLMYNSIEDLNNGPTEVCNLKTILFNYGGLSSINNDFLNLVPNLKVLDLTYNLFLWSLPEELCKLVSLQYLNLRHTNLRELPNEFKKLVKLKYLDVGFTSIYTIPEGILSSMKELSVFRCGSFPSITYYDFLSENLVKELEGLKCLQDVEIPATSKVQISNLLSSNNLLNCITRFTMTSFSDSTSLDISFLKKLRHLQHLTILHLKRVEKIVVGDGQGLETSTTGNQNGFNTLLSIGISQCSRLQNLSWIVFFPNIINIHVLGCGEMQALVSENEYKLDNEDEPFAKLRALFFMGVPKLESIYFTSLSFPCLESLSVDTCDNLKRLPFNSSSCDRGRGITIKGPSDWWKGLQWEDEATQTTFSSRFR